MPCIIAMLHFLGLTNTVCTVCLSDHVCIPHYRRTAVYEMYRNSPSLSIMEIPASLIEFR